MSSVKTQLPAGLIEEVAAWCSLQKLTAVHEDSPDEIRRRALREEASRLLDAARSAQSGLLEKLLPRQFRLSERIWAKGIALLQEADPDSLAPLEHQLRSPELKPPDSIGSSYSEESRREIINEVIHHRSALLKSRRQEHPHSAIPKAGRLLIYVPSENVSDGASRYASNGFFDLHDCPPWDTWLHYSGGTLVSWVPEILVPLVQLGIDGNAVDCVRWAD
jgi:hypothetical protein